MDPSKDLISSSQANIDLSSLDYSFLLLDSSNTQQAIGTLFFFDKSLDLSCLKKKIIEAQKFYPRLNLSIKHDKNGFSFCPSKNFDLNDHISVNKVNLGQYTSDQFRVKSQDLPSSLGEGHPSNDKKVEAPKNTHNENLLRDALAMLASKKLTESFDFSKPLWNFYYFEVQDSVTSNDPLATPGSTPPQHRPSCLLFKIHHSYTDGLGIVSLIEFLFGENTPDERQLRYESLDFKIKTKRRFIAVFRSYIVLLRYFYKIFREILSPKCSKKLRGTNSPERIINTYMIDKAKLRNIKKNCLHQKTFELSPNHKAIAQPTLNEIVIALFCQAYKLYQHSTHLPIIVPVNLRSREEKLVLGNFLGALRLRFPLYPPNFYQQLQITQEILQRSLQAEDHQTYALGAKVISLLPSFMRNYLLNVIGKKSCFIITNVNFPSSAVYKLNQATMTDIYGLAAPLKGHGFSLAVLRYRKDVFFSLVTDPKIIADPQKILGYLDDLVTKVSS